MKHEAIFSQYETHQQQVKEIQEEFLWLMKTGQKELAKEYAKILVTLENNE